MELKTKKVLFILSFILLILSFISMFILGSNIRG